MASSVDRVSRTIRKQSGAFDLPSVLIGVAVVAILAIGVMATIFGVIPWAQDRAAKQDLAAMNTAQGTAYARDGSFTDKAALVGAGWLGEGTPEALDAKADVEGKCYVAVTTSKTGNQFVISHDEPAPRELTTADKWCTGAPIIKDTAAVMITTWNTGIAASCKEITLPVTGFKGTVDWGDGTKNTSTTHAFAAAGPVTIRVDGTFTAWGGEGWADAGCLVSVDRWGATGTTNLSYAFHSANSLEHVESIPSTTATLEGAFRSVQSDFTIGHLDTSNTTTMWHMFFGAKAFNQPVDFDTSKLSDLAGMFRDAAAFNQPVNFDTSRSWNMEGVFNGAASFNHPVNFDTSKATTMNVMFQGAAAFNQPVNFNTSRVTITSSMFSGAKSFNQPVNFDTSNVTTMGTMFSNAAAFNQPVNFDTSKVTSMNTMFYRAAAFNQPVNFNTSRVSDMGYMFEGAKVFDQPLNFNTSGVKNMHMMFFDAAAFNQDLSSWNVSKVDDRANFTNTAAWTLPKPIWKL